MERTGIEHIDQLLDRFEASPRARWLELDRFRSPAHAEGRCAEVSEVVGEWLAQAGLDVDANPAWEARWYGYETEEWQDPTHCAVAVEHDGWTYTIDYTAAQYDQTEFPRIMRTRDASVEQPDWQDTWALRPTLSSSIADSLGDIEPDSSLSL
jgi:hypothetical protein